MSFDDYTKQGGRVPRQDVKTMEVPQPPLEGDYILTSKDGIVAWLPTPQSVEAGVLVGSRGKIGWTPVVAQVIDENKIEEVMTDSFGDIWTPLLVRTEWLSEILKGLEGE